MFVYLLFPDDGEDENLLPQNKLTAGFEPLHQNKRLRWDHKVEFCIQYSDVSWGLWCLTSLATQLSVQQLVQTKEKNKARCITLLLWVDTSVIIMKKIKTYSSIILKIEMKSSALVKGCNNMLAFSFFFRWTWLVTVCLTPWFTAVRSVPTPFCYTDAW